MNPTMFKPAQNTKRYLTYITNQRKIMMETYLSINAKNVDIAPCHSYTHITYALLPSVVKVVDAVTNTQNTLGSLEPRACACSLILLICKLGFTFKKTYVIAFLCI